MKIRGQNVSSGHTKSCGCLKVDKSKKHGHASDTGRSATYTTWKTMLQRCNNKKNPFFRHYGGRGIKVCKRWSKFENFLEDMNERPFAKSLDRMDNNKGYYKKNCRWATPIEQANNRRGNVFLYYKGSKLTVSQTARKYGIVRSTLDARLNRGWTTTHAITGIECEE